MCRPRKLTGRGNSTASQGALPVSARLGPTESAEMKKFVQRAWKELLMVEADARRDHYIRSNKLSKQASKTSYKAYSKL